MKNENLNKKKNKIEKEENFDDNIYDEKNIENQIINAKSLKISSSMKFYLFKKKFLKKYPNVNNICNLLSHEEYIIKK